MITIKFKIGDSEHIKKEIKEEDINLFARVTGDYNRIHIDEYYAKQTVFKNRVAHGMLTASLISTVLGTKFPGEGTILISISSKFKKPVYINDTIDAYATIKDIYYDQKKILFDCCCKNQKGYIVMEGEALVKFDKLYNKLG